MNALVPFVDTNANAERVQHTIESARIAQKGWAKIPIKLRLRIVRQTRIILAEEAMSFAEAGSMLRNRPVAETLTAEVLPLIDACRFLERSAARILQARQLGRRGRPLWLSGVRGEIQREPHGVILIIGPGNYPLFLPAVQALQALAAGNAAVIKPADGGSAVVRAFAEVLARSGLPPDLISILAEDAAEAKSAITNGVDKVILTGNAETGEAVLALCAKTLTPATVELSGCDALFVRADAELDLVVRALRFGLRLNAGATCIAPRRVFVHHSLAADLEARLRSETFETSLIVHPLLHRCVTGALSGGAELLAGSIQADGGIAAPLILQGVKSSMRLIREDIFAPMLSIVEAADDDEALAFAAQCPYALGASIFSRDESAAKDMAGKVRAGVVVINDLIVPTADPRVPFGGRGRSGFGTTRGAEGLLEMTVPKAISIRSGNSRPHFDEPQSGDSKMFATYLRAAHGHGWRNRFAAMRQIFRSIRGRDRRA